MGNKYRKKPTPKQMRVAKLLSDNLRRKKPKTKGQILRDAGYSRNQSERPGDIIDSENVQELMKKYIPNSLLYRTHAQLLDHGRLASYRFPKNFTEEQCEETINAIPGCRFISATKVKEFGQWKMLASYVAPDGLVRRYVLDMAYKLRGRYAAEQHEILFENMDDDQLVNFIMSKMTSKK